MARHAFAHQRRSGAQPGGPTAATSATVVAGTAVATPTGCGRTCNVSVHILQRLIGGGRERWHVSVVAALAE
eukprot:15068086-Alexandrium_andersonii.AAC.1